MSRHALLLINRKGATSHGNIDEGLRVLDVAGIEVSAHFCRRPGRIPELIHADHGRADMIIIGGGDGTLSMSLEAVLGTGLPLGIIPMGNANDLARTLAIPTRMVDAFQVIAGGHVRRIDVGEVNGKHFFNVASIGLSVDIAQRLTREAKKRWGVLAYAGNAWQAVRAASSFDARMRCGDETLEMKSIQVAVGNGRYYGGGMTVAEDATIDDRRLDLYAIERQRWWRLAVMLPALRWGKHKLVEGIHTLHGERIHIETDPPMSINVDGEVVAETPADFRVLPAALPVFVPQPPER
ncbi:MAG TPA: lipid kinase [Rhodospirillales bacterium]|nr:lipid kinase [Rhodospirillales bacterium]